VPADKLKLIFGDNPPLLYCEQVYRIAKPLQAKAILDELYEATESKQWVQTHGSGAEKIIRATLELDGFTLTVTAMSEARIERIADELDEVLPNAELISDEREEIDMPGPASAREGPPPATPELKAALSAWLDEREELWCDESIPALGGLTPKQAAADPTRREEVVRLIDSFDRLVADTEGAAGGFRPARLRKLLGIE
jgi:hypothetical protein